MATGYLGLRNEAKIFRKDYAANQSPTTVYTCGAGFADLFIESLNTDGSVVLSLTVEKLIDGTWVETHKVTISSADDNFSYTLNSNGGYEVSASTGTAVWTKLGAASTPQVIRILNGDRVQTEVAALGGGEDADLSFTIIESNMTVTDITA